MRLLTSIFICFSTIATTLPSYAKPQFFDSKQKYLKKRIERSIATTLQDEQTVGVKPLLNIAELFEARDGSDLGSDGIPLLISKGKAASPLERRLIKHLLANGMFDLSSKLIKRMNSQAPNSQNLTLWLEQSPNSQFYNDIFAESAVDLYQQLATSKTAIDEQTILKLAALLYQRRDFKNSRALLERVGKESKLLPAKEFLVALIAVKQGLLDVAANILKRICFSGRIPEDIRYNGCLAWGKIMANLNNYEQALDALGNIPGDANAFPRALYETIWIKWHRGTFVDTINTSEVWNSLFPFHTEIFEVERLIALSMLQSAEYESASKLYSRLLRFLQFEKRSVQELLSYYQNRGGKLVADFANKTVPVPLSIRLKRRLTSSTTFNRLLTTYTDIADIDEVLDDTKNRLQRLRSYQRHSPVMYEPEKINKIQHAALLLELTRPFQLTPPSKWNLENTKQWFALLNTSYQLTDQIEEYRKRYQEMLTFLNDRPSFFIGVKRRAFYRQVRQIARQLDSLESASKNLHKLTSEIHGSYLNVYYSDMVGQLPLQIGRYRAAQFNEESLLLAGALPPLLNRINDLKDVPRLTLPSLDNKIVQLERRTRELQRKKGQMLNRLKKLADSSVGKLLNRYAASLKSFETEIFWGSINSQHAHLESLQKESEELTKVKFKILNRGSKILNSGYLQ